MTKPSLYQEHWRNGMGRREIIRLALASPIVAAVSQVISAQKQSRLARQASFAKSRGRVVAPDGSTLNEVELSRRWRGALCASRITNRGRVPLPIKEVVLFDVPLSLPAETRLYGEGFQMLSQTSGTLAAPVNTSQYTDAQHYKLPTPPDARAFYGMVMLTPPQGAAQLFAFTSCRRFSGRFYLRPSLLQVVIDTEGLILQPGETWELEEFAFRTARADELPDELQRELALRLSFHHPPLRTEKPPAGWCSWYCFGPRVTAQQVVDNLEFIARSAPLLKYIQIDDGYQPAMGDWLETGPAFGGNVQGVLKQIKARGFEPAIWVAPFIAEEKSRLFTQHPDWFVKDAEGKPLRSDRVTFGGWRRGPWYALDGTHPEAQRHLEQVFRTMREDWGCTYFKLDGNFWGAIHGGRFHDPRATRIEAYRRGMRAILRGSAESFILGCNHPLWPSLGLIHGSRSSNDIKRTWDRFKATARQNLYRNWQNSRLWWNDPDAICLMGDLSADEFQFHATVIFASGGMVLSGDDLTGISPARLAMLKKLLPPSGVAARFEDDSLRVGTVSLSGKQVMCLFNWEDQPQTISFKLSRPSEVTDFWTNEKFGRHQGEFRAEAMPPHSARLLVCK